MMNQRKNIIYLILSITLGLMTPMAAQSASNLSQENPNNCGSESKLLAEKTQIEAYRFSSRLSHAKELLGKYYQKSIVKGGEEIADLDHLLNTLTQRSLRGKWKKHSDQVARSIVHESELHGFDPIFIMAVIENESSFNPEIVGSHGEIGLMQLTPDTAEWVANKYDIPWHGVKSLRDPATNIKIGSAYLSYLREKFEFHSQLYLAAYNMGTTNVKRALGRQIWPKDYPRRVMQRYVKFYTKIAEYSSN